MYSLINYVLVTVCYFHFFFCNAQLKDYDRTIKSYYVVEFMPIHGADSVAHKSNIQQKHLSYIKLLATKGKLVLAGPYLDGGGLFILNANDEDEAREWIENDPRIQNGLDSFMIRKWFTERGLFTLENLD